jgi:hypothetical protein
MSKNKIYIITKEKYEGHCRTIGFIRDLGKNIYYDLLSHDVQLKTKKDGSHYSYHEDGSIWRTSQSIGKEKITSTYPLKKFSTYYDLCTTGFDKKIVKELKPFDEKNRTKSILIEVEIEKFQSDFINIVLDMIHIDFYEKFLLNPESKYPNNADVYKRKLNSSVIIEAIFLGDMNNLLIVPKQNGFTVNHFNKRFTANDLSSNYISEWS